MSEIHETINMCVCVKVLSCDPKGDHVTFKWKKKICKSKPNEIYLHRLYHTRLTETFHTLSLLSLLFARECHESSRCFYGEVLAVARSLLTELDVTPRLDVTKTNCAKKEKKKKRVGAQWSGPQIKHRR